LQMSISG
jgi:hypothetical protein